LSPELVGWIEPTMARILIIDDDEALRKTLELTLTAAGHSVTVTPNGFEGVAAFRAAPADVIITDIMMPYGGLPTIRVLRAEFPQLKIIVMSGGGQPRLDIAKALGANHSLAKPFPTAELLDAIKTVLAADAAG
jgi:CheY-like chemotaxis protein